MTNITRQQREAVLLAAVDDLTKYEMTATDKSLATVHVDIFGSEGELLGNFDGPVGAIREFVQTAYRGVKEANGVIDEFEQIVKALETGDLSLLPPGVEIEVETGPESGVVYSNDNFVA